VTRRAPGTPPWRLLVVLAVGLYLVVPVRLVHARFGAMEARRHRLDANARTIERRVAVVRRVDTAALQADLRAVDAAMPPGGIESWIDGVSGLARATGATWRSGTVASPAPGAATAGEAVATIVTVVAEGPVPALLAFVDQLRIAPPRLTLVDDFAISTDPKDAKRSTVTLKVRLLSFTPAPPAAPAAA
jgi:hypothetical protein